MKEAQIVVYYPNGNSEEVEGFRNVGNITGLSKTQVIKLIRNGKTSSNGFAFDYAPDYVPKCSSYRIRLISPYGKEYIVNSIIRAHTIVGCSRTTFIDFLPRGEYRGWKIEQL